MNASRAAAEEYVKSVHYDSAVEILPEGWEPQDLVELMVRVRGGVTFVEITHLLKKCGVETSGTMRYGILDKGFVFWAGMSDAFIDIMEALVEGKRIVASPTVALVYVVDGGGLNFPLNRSARPKKRPHWVPVAYNAGPVTGDTIRRAAEGAL